MAGAVFELRGCILAHAGAGGRGRGKGKGAKKKAKKQKGRAGKAGLLFGVEWHRVVLDEAQSIKNAQTLASHASWGLKARAPAFWGPDYSLPGVPIPCLACLPSRACSPEL